MPEGPEVKRVASGLTKLEGKTITKALVVSGRYIRGKIHGLDTLVGLSIDRIAAKGKLITFYLRGGDEPMAILSTLGMTGWWVVLDTKEHEWDAYRRIEIQFDDGTVAAFFDPRNFGTFKVVSHAEAKRKQAELGPDILSDPRLWAAVTLPEFFQRVKRFGKKLTLAEALLDQRICSGCGNYIRADSMYLARFSPQRKVSEMTEAELKAVWEALYQTAVAAEAEDYQTLVYKREKSPTGAQVKSFPDGNDRTVWYSPEEQTL